MLKNSFRWNNSLGILVIISGLLLAFQPNVYATHPFHVGLFEAEWNATTGRLEVAVRVHPNDIQQALVKFRGEKIDLDKTPNIDSHLLAYFEKHLQLRPKGTTTAIENGDKKAIETIGKMHWIGKEIDLKWAWIYFEIEISSDQPLEMFNDVLMEIVPDQSNTVIAKSGKVRKTVMFRKTMTLRDFPRREELLEQETTVIETELAPSELPNSGPVKD